MNKKIIETLPENELQQFLELVYKEYGYDFSNYSEASFQRRIIRIMNLDQMPDLAALQNKIVNNPDYFKTFIEEVTVNVSEMFRDPLFYRSLVDNVFPKLAQLSTIRIWHAGCSAGEEVYSLAILLKEAGLLERSLLYATDINLSVLESAQRGVFPISLKDEYSQNYLASGGKNKLSDYYSENGKTFVFAKELSQRMVFSPHNLCIDQSFNEFNLILCRNVLIYFNINLQDKVIKLFKDSIAPDGHLALGTKETLDFSAVASDFESVDKKNRIWKIRKR